MSSRTAGSGASQSFSPRKAKNQLNPCFAGACTSQKTLLSLPVCERLPQASARSRLQPPLSAKPVGFVDRLRVPALPAAAAGTDCRQTYAAELGHAWGDCEGGRVCPLHVQSMPKWDLFRKFPFWRFKLSTLCRQLFYFLHFSPLLPLKSSQIRKARKSSNHAKVMVYSKMVTFSAILCSNSYQECALQVFCLYRVSF